MLDCCSILCHKCTLPHLLFLFPCLYGTYAKVTINNLPSRAEFTRGRREQVTPGPPAQEAPLSRKIVLENLGKIGKLNKGEIWVTEHLLSHRNSTEGAWTGPHTQRHLGSRGGIPPQPLFWQETSFLPKLLKTYYLGSFSVRIFVRWEKFLTPA